MLYSDAVSLQYIYQDLYEYVVFVLMKPSCIKQELFEFFYEGTCMRFPPEKYHKSAISVFRTIAGCTYQSPKIVDYLKRY